MPFSKGRNPNIVTIKYRMTTLCGSLSSLKGFIFGRSGKIAVKACHSITEERKTMPVNTSTVGKDIEPCSADFPSA